jgi:hypothetical protein
VIERLDALLAKPVDMRSLGLVRMLVGAVAVAHLWPIAIDAIGGDTYRDRFHHPYAAWFPELPEPLYAVVLTVGVAAAFAMSAGLWSRWTSKVTAGVVAYHLFLSTTHVHNNRAYLVVVLAVLAMAPCGRRLSVDARLRSMRGRPALDPCAPAWPLWLLRFECATVYGASGLSKLLDPDWFGGTVTWGRVVTQEAMVRASVLPGWVADLLLDREFHTVAAKVIVATELSIAAGLWWRRSRPFAIVAAVCFHVMIELSADVQVFSYLGVAVLFVWADPALPWLGRSATGRSPFLLRRARPA